ncbi:MAG: GGDEF domain-containing phosphodiesterase [Motiliproteus sp.]
MSGIVDQDKEIAKRVLQQSAKPYQLADGQLVHITFSIGISVFPEDGRDMKRLFSAADQAMYQAKSSGRYCFQFFTESMQQEADRHGWISNELKAAIEADLLKVYYRPIFNAEDGRFNKFEVLLRWPHPEQGCISPAEFIPVAEKCGLIRELGIYVREKACQQSRKWLDAGHDLSVSVNVSTLEFLDPDFSLSLSKP